MLFEKSIDHTRSQYTGKRKVAIKDLFPSENLIFESELHHRYKLQEADSDFWVSLSHISKNILIYFLSSINSVSFIFWSI